MNLPERISDVIKPGANSLPGQHALVEAAAAGLTGSSPRESLKLRLGWLNPAYEPAIVS